MTPAEFSSVSSDMNKIDASAAPVAKKRKVTKTPKEETPELKKLRVNEALRTSSLKTMKKQLDSAMQDIRGAEELIGKMPSKGYPSSMCEWFQSGCASFRAQHSEILKYYIDAMSEIPGTPWDADWLATSRRPLSQTR